LHFNLIIAVRVAFGFNFISTRQEIIALMNVSDMTFCNVEWNVKQ